MFDSAPTTAAHALTLATCFSRTDTAGWNNALGPLCRSGGGQTAVSAAAVMKGFVHDIEGRSIRRDPTGGSSPTKTEIRMTLQKYGMNWVAAVVVVAVVTLTACKDREPSVDAPPAPASSGEYPNPAGASTPSSSDPVAVPGQGADLTAKGPETGMVGGASGTVGSGGKPGSGSIGGAGTGAAVSSESKVETKK